MQAAARGQALWGISDGLIRLDSNTLRKIIALVETAELEMLDSLGHMMKSNPRKLRFSRMSDAI
jgi:hypothetical protein